MLKILENSIVQFLIALLFLLLLLIVAGRLDKTKNKSVKPLTAIALSLSLAVVFSQFKIEFLYGGSISILRMFFICIIGYWYGPTKGIIAGITYGLIDFVLKPYFVSPVQVLLDYPIAFGMLGVSGFFTKGKYPMQTGFVVASILRMLVSTISGIVFFSQYTPEGMNVVLYSLFYNASYILPEIILSLTIVSIPTFKNVIRKPIS